MYNSNLHLSSSLSKLYPRKLKAYCLIISILCIFMYHNNIFNQYNIYRDMIITKIVRKHHTTNPSKYLVDKISCDFMQLEIEIFSIHSFSIISSVFPKSFEKGGATTLLVERCAPKSNWTNSC